MQVLYSKNRDRANKTGNKYLRPKILQTSHLKNKIHTIHKLSHLDRLPKTDTTLEDMDPKEREKYPSFPLI